MDKIICALCGRVFVRMEGREEESEIKSFDIVRYGICGDCYRDKEKVEDLVNRLLYEKDCYESEVR